ncbi:MAG: peptidylprolyl isomerase [Cyanobacteria bacterium P01_H01_bin.119]
MTQATQGNTVAIHYTGRLEDGTIFDSSVERDPLEFTIGSGGIIPGFEQAVMGMTPGESKTATIPSENAYGPHRPEMVLTVERQQIPDDIPLEVGQQMQIRQPDGGTVPVIVTEMAEGKVTLDANHPLAGETLIFEIELVEIRSSN